MEDLIKKERELEDCLTVVAHAIDHHGDEYWPVYRLFEEELERLRSRRTRIKDSLNRIPTMASKKRKRSRRYIKPFS